MFKYILILLEEVRISIDYNNEWVSLRRLYSNQYHQNKQMLVIVAFVSIMISSVKEDSQSFLEQ